MRITRNERGAMALVAVFGLIAIVASVYYLTGIGQAIIAHERMQDGADAAAFSAAVVHARGMNLLALINIVMAALLAILVLLALLATLFAGGAKILAVASWLIFPLAAGVAPMQQASITMSQLQVQLRPKVMKVVEILDQSQEPLARAIPAMASATALHEMREHHAREGELVVTFPLLGSLPTTEDSFDELCDRAGAMAGKLVMRPIRYVLTKLLPDEAGSFLRSIFRKLVDKSTRSIARYICGVGPKPKALKQRVRAGFPELDTQAARNCAQKEDGQEDGQSEACREVEAELEASMRAYDVSAGECVARAHDGIGGSRARFLCEQRRREARRQCRPSKNKSVKAWTWIERRYTHSYQLVGEPGEERIVELIDGVEEGPLPAAQERSGALRGLDSELLPCARRELGFPVGGALSPWTNGTDEPLCKSKDPRPSVAVLRLAPGQRIDREILEVVDLLRCEGKKTIEFPVGGKALSEAERKARPQKLCSCASPGCELFQLRSIAMGPDPSGSAPDDGIAARLGANLGRFSFAQAEFYPGHEDRRPESWMWEMSWKARLRPFRLPEPSAPACKDDDCPAQASLGLDTELVAPILSTISAGLDELITH